jgi:hypothetical protein
MDMELTLLNCLGVFCILAFAHARDKVADPLPQRRTILLMEITYQRANMRHYIA